MHVAGAITRNGPNPEETKVDAGSRQSLVSERIKAGELPSTPAGRGTRSRCAACDDVISAPDFEYECRSADAVWVMCQPCLYAWDAVVREAERVAK